MKTRSSNKLISYLPIGFWLRQRQQYHHHHHQPLPFSLKRKSFRWKRITFQSIFQHFFFLAAVIALCILINQCLLIIGIHASDGIYNPLKGMLLWKRALNGRSANSLIYFCNRAMKFYIVMITIILRVTLFEWRESVLSSLIGNFPFGHVDFDSTIEN